MNRNDIDSFFILNVIANILQIANYNMSVKEANNDSIMKMLEKQNQLELYNDKLKQNMIYKQLRNKRKSAIAGFPFILMAILSIVVVCIMHSINFYAMNYSGYWFAIASSDKTFLWVWIACLGISVIVSLIIAWVSERDGGPYLSDYLWVSIVAIIIGVVASGVLTGLSVAMIWIFPAVIILGLIALMIWICYLYSRAFFRKTESEKVYESYLYMLNKHITGDNFRIGVQNAKSKKRKQN